MVILIKMEKLPLEAERVSVVPARVRAPCLSEVPEGPIQAKLWHRSGWEVGNPGVFLFHGHGSFPPPTAPRCPGLWGELLPAPHPVRRGPGVVAVRRAGPWLDVVPWDGTGKTHVSEVTEPCGGRPTSESARSGLKAPSPVCRVRVGSL